VTRRTNAGRVSKSDGKTRRGTLTAAGLSGAMAAAALASCSSGTAASPTTAGAGGGGWTHFVDNAPPTDLPASCHATPQLVPVTPTPTWPTNYQILDAVPGALESQYPTVYAGLEVAPAIPGESAPEINSHLIVLETVHDPTLEAEVTAAYPQAISVSFAIAPWTRACLSEVSNRVFSMETSEAKVGIEVVQAGAQVNHVVVGVTACSPSSEQAATKWFWQLWGALVSVQTCQHPAINAIGHASA